MNPSMIQDIAVMAIPVLLAITIHEAAHGYAARHFGDRTAEMLGRITLNPFKHVDIFGTVLIPLMLYFATEGRFVFGYAKPVPVNTRNLRNPRTDMVWVALAGPLSNLVQATAWALLMVCLALMPRFFDVVAQPFFTNMASYGLMVNLVLMALNLFPLPPLDGGRVAVGLLPYRPASALARLEPFGFFIILGLLLTGLLGQYWLDPLVKATVSVLLIPMEWIFENLR